MVGVGLWGTVTLNASANPALSGQAEEASKVSVEKIRVATWNIEHLAEKNGQGCRARDDADYQQLQTFAATLKADVVALQEVESKKAVERVFPKKEWDVIISPRPDTEPYDCREAGQKSTTQRVALAIRKGVGYDYDPDDNFEEITVGNKGLRYGVVVKLTDTIPATELMAVHLKSGCFVSDYTDSDREACTLFSQQVPLVDEWMESHFEDGTPFVMLGDFNHRLAGTENRAWREFSQMDLENNQTVSSPIINAMAGVSGCHPRYPEPIDHILLGSSAAYGYLPGSTKVHAFPGKKGQPMTVEDMLSDHCPITADIAKNPMSRMKAGAMTAKAATTGHVSTAVTWTQKAVEYKVLTEKLYLDAVATKVPLFKQLSGRWVVYMDVDETILDNSDYNKSRDLLAEGFSKDSWNEWVSKEAAGEVPGSKAFINSVLDAGGKIALITNRNREMDKHTWRNMEKLGYPMSRENICILGRIGEDKNAIGQPGIVNDKDLRRVEVASGKAKDCWKTDPSLKTVWGQTYSVAYEVGDNIQDFTQLLQKSSDANALSKLQGSSFLLLPNAMYGSWAH
nr:HAD family acid phosphatase [Marinibactrum halimedae]